MFRTKMEKDKLKTKQKFLKTLLPIVISVFLFLLGLILGLNLHTFSQETLSTEFRLSRNYKFTNPLLDCEVDQDIGKKGYNLSIQKIKELINKKINNNEISYASVYFRDLNNGPWYGINEKEPFLPASLLKVPMMISLLSKIESDPSFVNKEIIFEKEFETNTIQNFVPKQQLMIGQKYTIFDLIYRMIVYSDNQSTNLLTENIDQSMMEKVTKDLNIEYLPGNDFLNYISVKSYATFFRVLYNSSYLNRASSEKALKILSEVTYNKGILQGVPVSTVVAHKFGEREILGQERTKQLHDCGIIYYPGHPYILCIMTRGQDWNNLSKVIGEISKEIYTDIDRKAHENN